MQQELKENDAFQLGLAAGLLREHNIEEDFRLDSGGKEVIWRCFALGPRRTSKLAYPQQVLRKGFFSDSRTVFVSVVSSKLEYALNSKQMYGDSSRQIRDFF